MILQAKTVVIITFILTTILVSTLWAVFTPNCETGTKERAFELSVQSDSRTSYIKCDSVQMISSTTADAWINGTKMRIYSRNQILVSNNF